MTDESKYPFKSDSKPPSFKKALSKKRTMDEAFPERRKEVEPPSNTASKRARLRKEEDIQTVWDEVYKSFGLETKAKEKAKVGEKLNLMQELKKAVQKEESPKRTKSK